MFKKFKNVLGILTEILPYLSVITSSYAFYRGDIDIAIYFMISAMVYFQISRR